MDGGHYFSPFSGVDDVDAPTMCAWCADSLSPGRGCVVRHRVRVHGQCLKAYWADQRERMEAIMDACEREVLPPIRTLNVINYDALDDEEDE